MPRWITGAPAARAAASSGLSSGMAVDTTTSAPSGTFSAAWPIAGSIPPARRRARVGRLRAVGARDLCAQPGAHRGQPAHARPADADEMQAALGHGRRRIAALYVRRRRNCAHRPGFGIISSVLSRSIRRAVVLGLLTAAVLPAQAMADPARDAAAGPFPDSVPPATQTPAGVDGTAQVGGP